MRTEEILTALRRLKVETGSLVCMGCGREHDCGIHGCRIVQEAADLIEKLTDRCARYAEEIAVLQEREKWVPVTERRPEDGDVVLCWYEYCRFGEYNRMYQTYSIGYYINGMWGGDVSNGQNIKVLAWRPLPDGPEVEENAETE